MSAECMVMTLIHAVLILCPLAALRKKHLYPSLVFSMSAGIHAALCFHTNWFDSGYSYYFSAFVFSGICALVIMAHSTTRTALYLSGLSIVSMAANMYGWMLYETGACPTPYNNLFIAIYLSAVFVMLTGGKNGWKNYLPRVRALSFRRSVGNSDDPVPGLFRKGQR